MGKCRDCIHHDVCKDFIDTAFDGFLDEGEEILYDDTVHSLTKNPALRELKSF